MMSRNPRAVDVDQRGPWRCGHAIRTPRTEVAHLHENARPETAKNRPKDRRPYGPVIGLAAAGVPVDAQREVLEERRLAAAGIAEDGQPFEKERVGGRDDAGALVGGGFPIAARGQGRLFLRRHELSHKEGDVDMLQVERNGASRDLQVPVLVDHALEVAPRRLPVAQDVPARRFGSHLLGPVAEDLRARQIDGIECLPMFAVRLDLFSECSLAFGVFLRLLDRDGCRCLGEIARGSCPRSPRRSASRCRCSHRPGESRWA